MQLQFTVSRYLPDRTPTWTEVGLAVLGAVTTAPRFLPPSATAWTAVATGFVVFAVALGPAANTSFGADVGRWFREIGVAGRAAVIVLFGVSVVLLFQVDPERSAVLADAGAGGLLAVLTIVTIHVALAGGVSGLRRDEAE